MKYVSAVLGIAAIIGVSVFCGVMWGTLGPSREEGIAKTDDSLEAIRSRLGSEIERMEQKHERTITKVRYVREAVQAGVAALPADSVADELNRETGLFRTAGKPAQRVGTRPGGMDGAGTRVLGDGTRRPRFVGSSADVPP